MWDIKAERHSTQCFLEKLRVMLAYVGMGCNGIVWEITGKQ